MKSWLRILRIKVNGKYFLFLTIRRNIPYSKAYNWLNKRMVNKWISAENHIDFIGKLKTNYFKLT